MHWKTLDNQRQIWSRPLFSTIYWVLMNFWGNILPLLYGCFHWSWGSEYFLHQWKSCHWKLCIPLFGTGIYTVLLILRTPHRCKLLHFLKFLPAWAVLVTEPSYLRKKSCEGPLWPASYKAPDSELWHSYSQLVLWLTLNSFVMTPHSNTHSCSGFHT